MRKRTLWVGIGAAVLLVTAGVVGAAVSIDFGAKTEHRLAAHSEQLFGVNKPVEASSTADLDEAQALANPAGLVTLAKGLKAKVVSAGNAAPNLDQMVLWPQSSPRVPDRRQRRRAPPSRGSRRSTSRPESRPRS